MLRWATRPTLGPLCPRFPTCLKTRSSTSTRGPPSFPPRRRKSSYRQPLGRTNSRGHFRLWPPSGIPHLRRVQNHAKGQALPRHTVDISRSLLWFLRDLGSRAQLSKESFPKRRFYFLYYL